MPISNPRVAIVQHGDYRAALKVRTEDLPESYAGMKRSVDAIEGLIADREFLLVSLNGDSYRCSHRHGTLVGLPPLQLPRFLPRRLAFSWQRSKVIAEISRFAPTHLLIRTAGKLSIDLLNYCADHGVRCLVIFANVFNPNGGPRSQDRRLTELLNQSFVDRVANHLQPAVDSMIECGLHSWKAVPYDVDLPKEVLEPSPKEPDSSQPCRLVFAGSLVLSKGCGDVVLATMELHRRRIPVHLSVFGDGPDQQHLEQIAASGPEGLITFHGRQPNQLVGQAMRDSTFVCVASHREFPEGMPLTLTEALKSRTPVIASEHPVFIRAFQDGEGLRFVPEKQPQRIADAVEELWHNPAQYRRLSESTSQALNRIKCQTTMTSILREWSETLSNRSTVERHDHGDVGFAAEARGESACVSAQHR